MFKRVGLFVIILSGIAFCFLCLVACSPKTFIKTMEPAWANVELRDDVAYDNAWNEVADILIRTFDIAVMDRDNGYLRTGWLYTWTGKMTENYRVRVTIKFTPEHDICEIKSEAEYNSGGWIMGYDTRLLETIKSDIMGAIGRITR